MSQPSTSNVLSGKGKVTGAVFRAPLGTTLPANASDALASEFENLGYAGDSGLTETVDRSTSKIKAWGGDTVKVVQDEHSVTYKVSLIEEGSTATLKTVYGDDNVATEAATTTAGTSHTVKVNSAVLPNSSWDFEMLEKDNVIRIVIPNGQVTSVGDVSYVDDDIIRYEVEIEAMPDEDGNKAYKYIQLGDQLSE